VCRTTAPKVFDLITLNNNNQDVRHLFFLYEEDVYVLI
jgi:hypothetical protein